MISAGGPDPLMKKVINCLSLCIYAYHGLIFQVRLFIKALWSLSTFRSVFVPFLLPPKLAAEHL